MPMGRTDQRVGGERQNHYAPGQILGKFLGAPSNVQID